MVTEGARRAEPLKDFCRSLGVSYDSGRRAVRTGKLKTIRFGHLVLVPADEIERVQREGLETGHNQPEAVVDGAGIVRGATRGLRLGVKKNRAAK